MCFAQASTCRIIFAKLSSWYIFLAQFDVAFCIVIFFPSHKDQQVEAHKKEICFFGSKAFSPLVDSRNWYFKETEINIHPKVVSISLLQEPIKNDAKSNKYINYQRFSLKRNKPGNKFPFQCFASTLLVKKNSHFFVTTSYICLAQFGVALCIVMFFFLPIRINKLKHTKEKFLSLEARHFPHLLTHEIDILRKQKSIFTQKLFLYRYCKSLSKMMQIATYYQPFSWKRDKPSNKFPFQCFVSTLLVRKKKLLSFFL